MNLQHRHRFPYTFRWLPCIMLLTGFLAGCGGYHFPGSQVQAHPLLQESLLKISGKGAKANPQITFLLRDRLQTRLGLTGQARPTADGGKKQRILKIILEPMAHALVAEDRAGRADQYRVTVRAQPFVEGGEDVPTFPVVQGTASYYEAYVSTSVQATRKRAEAEAMERLADTLVAILSGEFEP